MSLPFLQPKKMASVIIARKQPEKPMEALHEEGESPPALLTAAEDLISAVHRKDAAAVAEALQAAFDLADSMPEEMDEEA